MVTTCDMSKYTQIHRAKKKDIVGETETFPGYTVTEKLWNGERERERGRERDRSCCPHIVHRVRTFGTMVVSGTLTWILFTYLNACAAILPAGPRSNSSSQLKCPVP